MQSGTLELHGWELLKVPAPSTKPAYETILGCRGVLVVRKILKKKYLESWKNFGLEKNRARVPYKRPLGLRHTFRLRRNVCQIDFSHLPDGTDTKGKQAGVTLSDTLCVRVTSVRRAFLLDDVLP